MSDLVKHICFEIATNEIFVNEDNVKVSFLNGDWTIEICVDRDDDECPFAEAFIYLCKETPTEKCIFVTSRTCIVDWNKIEREAEDCKSHFDTNISSSNIWHTFTSVFKDYVSDVECYRSYLKIELWLSDRLQTKTVPELRESPLRCSSDIQSGLENLSQDFSNLLDDGISSDVILAAENQTINAHKLILSARSKVFKAMFQHDMIENRNNSVEIQDIDYDVLDIFVKYLYTGKFPAVTAKTASELYAAADKYAVGQLKTKCAAVLSSSVSKDSVLNILNLANSHSDLTLKQRTIDFVLEHEEILDTNEWSYISQEQPKLAVEVYRAFVEDNKKRREALGEYLQILSKNFAK